MAAERLHALHGDDRFDVVIVDTPPTRNALDFLDAPGVITRFLDHPLFKLMMLPTRRGLRMLNIATQPIMRTIGQVVGGDVLADAIAFFQAFDGMETGLPPSGPTRCSPCCAATSRRYVLVASPRGDTVDGGGVLRRAACAPPNSASPRWSSTAPRRRSASCPRGARGGWPRRRCSTTSPSCTTRRPRSAATSSPLLDELALDPDAGIGVGAPACRRRPRPRRPVDDPRPAVRLTGDSRRGARRARPATNVGAVHILIGTDADYVVNDVKAALGGPDVSFTVCRNGRAVTAGGARRATPTSPCSTCRSARWARWPSRWVCASTRASGVLPHVKVLMLLDRQADVHLAKRCGAEEWLVKPVDALTLKRAAGGCWDVAASQRRSTRGGTRLDGGRAVRRRPTTTTTPEEDAASGRIASQPLFPGTPGAAGCSAAWLARHVRDVEAGSSNLPTPTSEGLRSAALDLSIWACTTFTTETVVRPMAPRPAAG